MCGCALVTVTKIVTAGHCVMRWKEGKRNVHEASKGTVYFGTTRFMGDDGQSAILKSVMYPKDIRKKASGGIMHDYATAELMTPIQITDTVKLLSVYSKDKTEFKNAWDEMVTSKAPCIIAGWGATNFRIENDTIIASAGSPYLKMTMAQPWEEQKCERYFGPGRDNMVPFGEVCLLGVKFGDTALPGDSGSPLICGDYVWGVCSSMIIDSSGREPFQYLLHWNYLNDFLFESYGSGASLCSENFILLLFLIFLGINFGQLRYNK
ncbi:kallikrein-6-like [Cimex lectularius]|uniref:Peptidase S1 domain-containing protein n=1 Tax=Cimex lectularius TaxID=79782 RepID=A0A8I6RHD8_CIMLE|nr:kallikrein-6-like [Cimex lectularius]